LTTDKGSKERKNIQHM